jgi:hypothetical protein
MCTNFSIRKIAPTWSLIGLFLIGLTQASPAQTLSDTERDAIARDGAEKRRNQARESQLKEQQSKTPEVHLGNRKKITFSYFKTDPIPVGTGGNPGVMSLSEFWNVLTTSNSAHSCYGTGVAGCQQVQILSPNAPVGAVQDNSNLVQYIGGKSYDSNMKPLDLKH